MEIQEIKKVRQEITAIFWSIGILNPSREVSLAYTNTQRSKAWLGKVLQTAGAENPYPQSSDPQSNVIEKQADVPEEELFKEYLSGIDQNQTALVKAIRKIMQETIDTIKGAYHGHIEGRARMDCDSFFWSITYLVESILALEEARMWLGWELNRILQQILAEEAPQDHKQRINLPLQ